MDKLMPCPFCGGRATVKTRYIGYGSIGLGEHDEYRVVCKECRASNDEYRREAEAIAAWNRRADAVQVVRCVDCKYRELAKVNCKGYTICPASGMEITDDDFCSYGERKEDRK